MEQQPLNESSSNAYPEPKRSFWESSKTLIKGLFTGILTLIMLIPAAFIQQLVQERKSRQQEVIQEVSDKWATAQTVKGPVLLIPYWENVVQADKSVTRVRKHACFMPEALTIGGVLNPELRHRSIYEVTLYRSSLNLAGTFPAPDLSSLAIPADNIIWQEATLVVGVDDLRGLEENMQLNWNGTDTVFEAGVPENGLISNGLSHSVAIAPGKPCSFSIDLKLKGSGQLLFTPVGKTTKVNIKSSWQHPSFEGKFIPSESAAVTAKGFDAHWSILQVSSGIPRAFKDQQGNLDQSAFGVRLLQPADGYAKTQRSVKYALLFISLTFTIFFFIELLQRKQIHPLQYILVGLALCVFYTLLLSFTEYCGFNIAYSIAASATISLIGLYAWSIFKQGKTALLFTSALAALYGYIFVLIQLEDYALLFGSIGLFLILAVIMYYSRKIDWYGTLKQKD